MRRRSRRNAPLPAVSADHAGAQACPPATSPRLTAADADTPIRRHALQLVHGIAVCVCHPDIGSVKGDANGVISHAERAKAHAITGPQLGHRVAVRVCHPDVGSVKGDASGTGSRGERAQVGAVAGPQLVHGVAVPAYDPDVGSVKGDSTRGVYGEVAEVGAVAGPQLAHIRKIACCNYPDIDSVKRDAKRVSPQEEGAKRNAVARPQLGHALAVCHPDIGSVKGDTERGKLHAEGPEGGAVTCPQLGHAVAATVCHPDTGSVKGDAKRPVSNAEVAQ